ncbi:hypothetical protein [Pseudomonas oryzihabitans]|uniref:hypothetical protein n=1 Tax=Pseudomonas oryzihabitans TaxID=47885 RepID=UPI002866A1FB|nr:hypothetical protein [Pseudomonas psychrotolerans]MDR6675825.1 hypothetical protein [Pseudomonas psychrotolerans]
MSAVIPDQLLKGSLAYAIKQTIAEDRMSERRAWLTRFGVYALYPAIYPAMLEFLQRHAAVDELPSPQVLLDRLVEINAVPSPRGFGVRQTRSICESLLNIALEVKPEDVWGIGERLPEQWHITTAMGHWYHWVADRVGLPSTSADQHRLYLHTLRPKLTAPPEETPASANPDVVLAIYWPATEFELDLDTRSIW